MVRDAARDARLLAMRLTASYLPETSSSTSRSCSLPKNISLPTKKVGEPNAPRSTADWVFSISFALTSGSCARANSFAASRPEADKAFAATSGSSIFFGSTHMWWKAASTYFSNTPSNCAATAARMMFSVLTGKNGFHVYGLTAKRFTKRSVSSAWNAGLFLTPASVSAGDLLLVALKMPPSRIGTYSNLTCARFSIAGIASWLRKAFGLPKSNRNCGFCLTAVSPGFLYDPYHFKQPSGSGQPDQPERNLSVAAKRAFRQF